MHGLILMASLWVAQGVVVPFGPFDCRAVAPTPAAHRLADVRGVIWESDDPDRLKAWVGAVNRVYAAPPVPAYRPDTSCAGGNCVSGGMR